MRISVEGFILTMRRQPLTPNQKKTTGFVATLSNYRIYFRYKPFEEAQLQKEPKIVEDPSHCNFDSPEIQITSKGILRASTYKQKGEVLATEESSQYN